MSITATEIRSILDKRFGGVLTKGSHAEDGQACALELLSVVRGIPWTDNPKETRTWDLRALNDVDVSDEIRTEHLVPVLATFAGSLDWPLERQQAVAIALVVGTVREIVAELPMLPQAIAEQCRQAKTLPEATRAARAVWAAASADNSVARAARAASAAASAAAGAAAWGAAWGADWAAAGAAAWGAAWGADWAASADSAASAAWAADWAASAAASAAAGAAAWGAAWGADWAASADSAASAAWAADWAARAADSAAWAADWAARAAAEKVFIQACSVWLDAAQASVPRSPL